MATVWPVACLYLHSTQNQPSIRCNAGLTSVAQHKKGQKGEECGPPKQHSKKGSLLHCCHSLFSSATLQSECSPFLFLQTLLLNPCDTGALQGRFAAVGSNSLLGLVNCNNLRIQGTMGLNRDHVLSLTAPMHASCSLVPMLAAVALLPFTYFCPDNVCCLPFIHA